MGNRWNVYAWAAERAEDGVGAFTFILCEDMLMRIFVIIIFSISLVYCCLVCHALHLRRLYLYVSFSLCSIHLCYLWAPLLVYNISTLFINARLGYAGPVRLHSFCQFPICIGSFFFPVDLILPGVWSILPLGFSAPRLGILCVFLRALLMQWLAIRVLWSLKSILLTRKRLRDTKRRPIGEVH